MRDKTKLVIVFVRRVNVYFCLIKFLIKTLFVSCLCVTFVVPLGQHIVHNLKFAQLNTHKSPTSLSSFIDFCNNNFVDIMLISEPPIKKCLPNLPSPLTSIHQQRNNNMAVVTEIIRHNTCCLNRGLRKKCFGPDVRWYERKSPTDRCLWIILYRYNRKVCLM